MFPVCVLMLCLQWGRVCHAVQMLNLQVEYGESATLPCDGSAHQEDEGSVRWEAMGEDVAVLQGGEKRAGETFKGRVQLPSEGMLRGGDWSVVLEHTVLSDTDVYQCIWQEATIISTVWLTVTAPDVERHVVVPAGDTVDLSCYIQLSRRQTLKDLQVWWTRDGSTIASTTKEALFSEDTARTFLSFDTKGAFHLNIGPTIMRDNGEYHCLYKTRDSDDPRPGTPQSITLTVLGTNHTDVVKMTEQQPTEAFEETETVPGEGTREKTSESLQWDTVPWVRIGLISGVLLVTAVAL